MMFLAREVSMQKIPMTIDGAKQLRNELEHLKHEQRPKIAKAIAEARALGDLKENAEYHAAKEWQGLTEARIRDLEHKLANANIIDVKALHRTGRVVFGVTVELIDTANQGFKYQLVGDDEADGKNKISIYSPLARALVGKAEGDFVEVKTPGGMVGYEIMQVLYE